jgi:hypothetical protein
MGAPAGNQNANIGKRWRVAIDKALDNRSLADQQDALERVAQALIVKALEGDLEAIKVLGDRLDGKPAQAVALTGAGEGPIRHEFAWAQSE